MTETPERWKQLCEQAAVELDPARLLELCQEINRILEEKDRVKAGSSAGAESERKRA
jgi:hypothetical protein